MQVQVPVSMSDEEHHFESKADAGASKTYPQQAGTIRKNGYIVIKGRPCKVVEVSTSKTGKHGHAKCHFVGIDIFNAKKLEDIVPHVTRTDYQLIDISEDGFLSLLTENGNTKDDLRLPTDENLLSQVTNSVVEEFVCGLVLEDQSNGSRIQLASNSTEVPKLERLRDFSMWQIKDGFAEGKDLVVTVMSAMGEEQICALKDIGPK
ncbi:hypothetical protein ZIOFF_028377 [Zingiber officinale]|uniref:Translation initiation factor 5A C-terminal domain-containing protein n=1 Tax=Zingiber officinale TaxID=94328 RepID=A0A8J5GPR1_ZINOF|nr:hypothetical protein ZIOFF_028377 [Zingiber officinale]